MISGELVKKQTICNLQHNCCKIVMLESALMFQKSHSELIHTTLYHLDRKIDPWCQITDNRSLGFLLVFSDNKSSREQYLDNMPCYKWNIFCDKFIWKEHDEETLSVLLRHYKNSSDRFEPEAQFRYTYTPTCGQFWKLVSCKKTKLGWCGLTRSLFGNEKVSPVIIRFYHVFAAMKSLSFC